MFRHPGMKREEWRMQGIEKRISEAYLQMRGVTWQDLSAALRYFHSRV